MSTRSRLSALSLMVLAATACAAGSHFADVEPADACRAVRTQRAPFESADLAQGARRFETDCAQCHSLSRDREKLPGPHLHDLVLRVIGRTDSFRYSRALRDREDRWTLAALDQYIADPDWFIPDTRMNYPGLNNPSERLNLIAFLSCSER